MKYVSIDIETTGLDPENCQILQIAMVVDDTEWTTTPIHLLPRLNIFIAHENIYGEPEGIRMNGWIFDLLHRPVPEGAEYKIVTPKDASAAVAAFLDEHFKDGALPVAAGKCVGSFDIPFLKGYWAGMTVKFHHRTLDPMPYFIDWTAAAPPSLATCLKNSSIGKTFLPYLEREGLPSEQHNALTDALTVVALLRLEQGRV